MGKVLFALAILMVLAGVGLLLFVVVRFFQGLLSSPKPASLEGEPPASSVRQSPVLVPKTLCYGAEEVRNLSVEDPAATVNIYPSEDGQVRIDLQEDEKNPYQISLSGKKLSIRRLPDKRVFWGWSSSNRWDDSREISVYLPARFGDLSVSTTNGNIVADSLSFSRLSLSTVNGDVKLSDVHVADDDLQAHTVNGNITFRRSGAAAGSVHLKTVNGDIRFEDLFGPHIAANSVSGDIKGVVTGHPEEYDIYSSTVNGNKEIPRSGRGPNQLRVGTVNGDIDVDIRPAN